MASLWRSLILAIWVSVASAQPLYAADDPNNHFNYPGTPGTKGDYSTALRLPLGVPVQILWNTNYSAINLYLWQDKNTGETLASTAPSYPYLYVRAFTFINQQTSPLSNLHGPAHQCKTWQTAIPSSSRRTIALYQLNTYSTQHTST
jgi:hypothetical protein